MKDVFQSRIAGVEIKVYDRNFVFKKIFLFFGFQIFKQSPANVQFTVDEITDRVQSLLAVDHSLARCHFL